jgi:hypothetical protein
MWTGGYPHKSSFCSDLFSLAHGSESFLYPHKFLFRLDLFISARALLKLVRGSDGTHTQRARFFPRSARLLKFLAAHGTFGRIVSFHLHAHFAIEADANITFWTVTGASLNPGTAHIAESSQATVNHLALSPWLKEALREG